MHNENVLSTRFAKPVDHSVQQLNGDWSGQIINDMLLVDLVLERPANPDMIMHALEAEGSVPGEYPLIRADCPYFRKLLLGIVMTAATARQLGQWLIRSANELEATDQRNVGISPAEETMRLSEETLGRVWNTSEEDETWHGL